MTVVIVPVGRGNWRRVALQIPASADLFPTVRDRVLHAGERWFLADRWWRVVEVRTA
jgi:hypothetical protein